MNRAARLSLFALGTLVGSLCLVFASNSTDADDVAIAEFGFMGEDVARARAESTVERQIGEVRAQAEQRFREAANHESRNEPEEALSDDELESRVRERGRRRAALITDAIEREPVDPEWGPATEQMILERFAAEAPPSFELLSATCKASLCMAVVETPSRRDSTRQMGWHRLFGLSRAYVHHRGEEGDGFRTVVFLARDGHSLPK